MDEKLLSHTQKRTDEEFLTYYANMWRERVLSRAIDLEEASRLCRENPNKQLLTQAGPTTVHKVREARKELLRDAIFAEKVVLDAARALREGKLEEWLSEEKLKPQDNLAPGLRSPFVDDSEGGPAPSKKS